MPMFKLGRRAKDEDEVPTAMSKATRSLTRRKKKPEIEEKPVIDLTTALPDTNDFRTSLIMPNLSARFSMLREQDDPTSKIGKAADDSVLFPKRASRMNLFAHNPLADIAEVESIRDSIRKPFADRHGSTYSDGYGSDDGGSIMNRSRPGEGNNLFGGRQKLYKITNQSARNLNAGGSSGMISSKHMYENDVSLSAFQQYRLREKERREADNIPDRNSASNADTDDPEIAPSPSTSFSKNRGTQSSTNSGPSNRRTSTAATSVASDSPIARKASNPVASTAVTKPKESDVNSSAESIGFSASPSFRKMREDGSRPQFNLSQSRSAANLRNDYSKSPTVFASGAYRPMSPPLSAGPHGLDFGLKDFNKTSRFNTVSPTPQMEPEQDDANTFTQNVQPNDRGKATAMGLFNKPQKTFDEQQFLQRQLQMHEGRTSPFSTTSRSASRASPELQKSDRKGSVSAPSPAPSDRVFTPQVPPIPDYPPSPALTHRGSSALSSRDNNSRARSKSTASVKEAAVKARVESLIRRQNAELAALEAEQLGQKSRSNSVSDKDARGTFFDNDSDVSEAEERSRRPSVGTRDNRPPLSPSEVHPALRDFNFGTKTASSKPQSTFSRDSNYSNYSRNFASDRKSKASEYETVPEIDDDGSSSGKQQAGLGLSGMIRTHLRHDSDRSSLPPPSPALPQFEMHSGRVGSTASTTKTVTESTKSDPFELDNGRLRPEGSQKLEQPPTPTTVMSQKAQQILGIATALRNANPAANNPAHGQQNEYASHAQNNPDATSHHRNFSTETQEEQKRFDDDLAERRRRIQEGLKSSNDRSISPNAPNARSGPAFSLPQLRGKTNAPDQNADFQPKAMKMLGMNGGPRDYSGPPSRPQAENWNAEQDRYRDAFGPPRNRQRTPPEHELPNGGRQTPNQRQPPPQLRGDFHDRPPPPRSTTPSGRSSRNRSNSGAGERSMSRNRQYADTPEPPMPHQYNSPPSAVSPPHREAGRAGGFHQDGRSFDRSTSATGGIYRDKQGYFTQQPLDDQQHGYAARPSPRPGPTTVDSSESLPRLPLSPAASTTASPNPTFDTILTNNTNGRSTPNGRATPTAGTGRVTPSGPGQRKKSISKHMISEPTFVSSTSSVPLVHLPQHGGPLVEPHSAPPIPAMNPRRRGNPGTEGYESSFAASQSPRHNVQMTHESGSGRHGEQTSQQTPAPRQRNKLRKSSSEGGNMAAKARQQALMADLAREKERSPAVPVFPNRSATALGMNYHDGGMF